MKSWKIRSRDLALGRPRIMAIVNATPDSFSDGGQFAQNGGEGFLPDLNLVLYEARKLIESGATILDVGGESTRPGSDPVDEKTEIARVVPVIRAIKERFDVPVSVDTYRPAVAEAAIEAGADIINDVAAGRFISSEGRFAEPGESFSEEMADLAQRTGAGVVLMHMRGTPKTMQNTLEPYEGGVVESVGSFLVERRDAFLNAGVPFENIALDPGLGFGKTSDENWRLVLNASKLKVLGSPVLIGHSRKSFLRPNAAHMTPLVPGAERTEEPTLEQLDFTTAIVSAEFTKQGIDVIRVHNVAATAALIRTVTDVNFLSPFGEEEDDE